jgi:hypothetical protein
MEKAPKDYSQGTFQKIVEYLDQKISRADRKAQSAYQDLSQDFTSKLAAAEKKLSDKIAGKDEMGLPACALPSPQGLEVYEAGLFGWAHCDPFYPWKYFGKVQGYEFFGSPNDGFEPHQDPYTETGYHRGTNGSIYLNTEDAVTPSNTFVFTFGLVGKSITNVTSGVSGTIKAYNVSYIRYRIRCEDEDGNNITWNTGDQWRIYKYPSNRLFSIGSQAIFVKRPGTYYVRARTRGRGHSYSEFTKQATSSGLTSGLDVPVIVPPKHNCGLDCTIDGNGSPNWGKPRCPTHGIVPWDEIKEGTREIEHYVFFGVEWCNVEVVWEAIDTEKKGVWYDVRRGHSTTTEIFT